MREPLFGIGPVHRECVAKVAAAVQKEIANLPLASLVGKYVKLAFPTQCEKPKYEHMWVKITHWQRNKLHGILDNDPIYADCQFGDEFEFQKDEIEDISD